MSDRKHDGIEHLERSGCIINIREGLFNQVGKKVTSITIVPDPGWSLEGAYNSKVIEVVNIGR